MGSLPDAAHATGRVIYGGDPGDAGAGASGLSWREAGALALGAIGRGGAPFRERARS